MRKNNGDPSPKIVSTGNFEIKSNLKKNSNKILTSIQNEIAILAKCNNGCLHANSMKNTKH